MMNMFVPKGGLLYFKQQFFSKHSFRSVSVWNKSLTISSPQILINKALANDLSTQVLTKPVEEDNLNYAYYEEVNKKALSTPDFFNVKRLINLREMFDARVYMGHKVGTLNENMKPYIFGSRLDHLIIDLDQTVHLLQEALNFAAHIAFRHGIILFINKSATTGHIVEQTAKNCGEYSHCREYRKTLFNDSKKIYGAVTRLPDLLIFLNTTNNVFEFHPAITDAARHMIPTIGVVDTNTNPTLITYPVPGNDDSIQSITYFCRLFEEVIKIGKQKRLECLQKVISKSH